MTPFVSTVNQILSLLTISAQIISTGLLAAFLIDEKKAVLGIVARYAVLISFIVALTAAAGSLFYSEIAGFEPCKLC